MTTRGNRYQATFFAFVFSLLAGIAVGQSTSTPTTPVPTTPQGFGPVSLTSIQGIWTFNGGSLLDSSGNSRTLTQTGTIAYNAYGGKFFEGAVFDANASNYLARASDDAAFDFGSGDFTVSVWVTWGTGAVSSGEQVIVEKFVGPSTSGWTLYKKNVTPAVEFFASGIGLTLTGANTLVCDGRPAHVCVTRISNAWTLYYNNVRVSTSSTAGTITDSAATLLFGQRNGGTSLLDGTVDDAAIWSRGLSRSEVGTLYRQGYGTPANYTR